MRKTIVISTAVMLGAFSCTPKMQPTETTVKEEVSTTEPTQVKEEVMTEIESESEKSSEVVTTPKVTTEGVQAVLHCEGKSGLTQLQISARKMATQDYTCKVSANNGLHIVFTSQSQQLEITMQLHKVDLMSYPIGIYKCKSKSESKYLEVSLKGKEYGTFNFGETFTGELEITGYGMSSNVVCGTFNIVGPKGNIIKGRFNEVVNSL